MFLTLREYFIQRRRSLPLSLRKKYNSDAFQIYSSIVQNFGLKTAVFQKNNLTFFFQKVKKGKLLFKMG